MVALEFKFTYRYIASELEVALLLRGEGVALGEKSSPVNSYLATSPFGDRGGDRGRDGGGG